MNLYIFILRIKSITIIYSGALIIPDLALGSPLLKDAPHPSFFWGLTYFLEPQDVPNSSCAFPTLTLESAVSPFPFLKIGILSCFFPWYLYLTVFKKFFWLKTTSDDVDT